ncbi:MAG: tetratricopeptide repeat protein [Elusimicrobia bacterium]|nr:tetratricopeptide repeat protein [Elusimicrobiota bacterium]
MDKKNYQILNKIIIRLYDDMLIRKIVIGIFLLINLSAYHHITCLYPAFDEFSPGVRPASLGGAFTAISDDANAVFYNPAGLYRVEKNEFLASYGRLYFGLDDDSNIGTSLISYINPFGKYGTAGLGIYSLSLSGLYSEKMISFSYGFRVVPKLGFGLTMKSLSHKYGSDEYTVNAINESGDPSFEPDPVFKDATSKSKLSSDVGIFYRPDAKYNLGFTMQNINSPDIGLKETDKVEKTYMTGFAYTPKTANMSIEILSKSGDTNIISGFEKYFSQRVFALRGSLTFGSSDLRRLTLGFGINQKNYKLDYVFLYPLVGINETYGTHKVSVSVLFGPIPAVPKFEPEFPTEEELEEKPLAEEVKPPVKTITDDDRKAAELLIKNVQDAYRKGMYSKATENINRALELNREHQGAQSLKKKLVPIASIIPEKTETTRIAKITRKGVTAYLENNPVLALNAIRYATELAPDDISLGQVFELMSKEYPDVAAQEKSISGMTLVQRKLQQSLENIYDGKYVQAIAECNTVLELEEDNIIALTRLGSAYWAMGDTAKAKSNWRKALEYDPDNSQIMDFLKEKPGAPKIEKPKTYIIKKGDTLPNISERFYGDKSQWRKIYELNKDKLDNPYKLNVGQSLTLP